MIPAPHGVLNTEGKEKLHSLEHSKIVANFNNQGAALNDSKNLRRTKNKEKRLPSARVDKEPLYNDIAPNLSGARVSNSLKRKKRLYDNKLSMNKKNEEFKEIRYNVYFNSSLVIRYTNNQRQYSMNSMMIKNQNISNQNINSFDFKPRGNNWFNGKVII